MVSDLAVTEIARSLNNYSLFFTGINKNIINLSICLFKTKARSNSYHFALESCVKSMSYLATKTHKNTNMKLNIFLISIIFLFFSFSKLQAQNEEKLLDFFHSGNVTTENRIVKVPIEIWNNLILLKVKVNGNDATFLWDNGFSISGIDTSLAQQYQFLPFGDINNTIPLIDGNNAIVNVDYLVCPKIEIKGIAISNTPFILFDSRAFTLTKNLKIDGVLGASIINKLNWKFNFDKNYLEISEKAFTIEQTNLVLPFTIKTNNNHAMPITLNDIEAECSVDFGFNSDKMEINKINAKHFSNANATKTLGLSSISVSGLAPIDTVYTIKDNFTWKLADKKLDFLPKISFSTHSPNLLIGNKLFRDRYNVIINTSGDTVYALSARTKPNNEATDKAYGYILLTVEGKFRIAQIIPNTNTINNTIQLMDEVISINGKKPNDFKDNYSLMDYQKKSLRKEKKVILKLINGKEISIIPQQNTEFQFKKDKELW